MTRDDCKRIMDNIEVIRHFAEGGEVESCLHRYDGVFVGWYRARTLLIACLGRYRIVKQHVQLKGGEKVILPSNPNPCREIH